MRKLIALVIALMLLAIPASVSAGGRPFVVHLTGAAERPDPADPDGSGTAWLTLNSGQQEVCWVIFVENITLPATAAHIHVAPSTDPGPVVIPLSAPDATGWATGCATDVDRELIKAIQQNPSAYYVNVHNADYPAGAVRGQLSK